ALGQSVAIDVEAFQSHLHMVIENDQLRRTMGERSRRRAEALYSFPAVVRQYEELWSELAIVARGLSRTRTSASFNRTRYFECFKNHASSVLTDDSCFGLTVLGQEINDTQLRSLLHPRVSAGKTIDFDLVRCALDELKKASKGNGSSGKPGAAVRFGEFTDWCVGNRACGAEYGRLNLMWLIKHGLVKPEAPVSGRQGASQVQLDYFQVPGIDAHQNGAPAKCDTSISETVQPPVQVRN